ncbi:MAG: tRNA preQ1(34) S-adenosylmethionine ribosyltransferase-isomerase QueA [Burkholderiales bacterium]|nr:tRNA preQ1(34) S-adenosylmethionine ribosyltransferase-isomerase QueA [Burkholderiales bacterium]
MLKVSDFDYFLPPELIAYNPPPQRDSSRLLIVNAANSLIATQFKDIVNAINKNDLVIFNNSKVIKARLFGNKISGGKIEVLIERILTNNNLLAFVRSNKKIYLGMIIQLPNNIKVEVVKIIDGNFELALINNNLNWLLYLEQFGHIPLPHYIKRFDTAEDEQRYQTVYAKLAGSVAAPTAGLHFTNELLASIEQKGAKCAFVTLHVGAGTFKPVTANYVHEHKMHSEYYSIEQDTITAIENCHKNGGNIIAVGTTTLRTLETAAQHNFTQLNGETDIFITPGFKFKVVNKLITNFHLPKSTLLMLVSAFAGSDVIQKAYSYAIDNKFRFFSYGDAMLLKRKD